MTNTRDLTQKALDNLLLWLDPDPEKAGRKYETIRSGLIRIFTCRGCFDAEELADETINRVALKVEELVKNYTGAPSNYFFGVAKKVYLEYQRKKQTFVPIDDKTLNTQVPQMPDEIRFECLEYCMHQLAPAERELLWHYYEVGASASRREELARRLGLKLSTLRVKVFRLTSILEKCLNNCIRQSETG
jgi:DNA-directed RNA polymerase specialized sigma24 family protein